MGHHRVQWPGNVVWLVFESWVISYANEWEDHSNNWIVPWNYPVTSVCVI